MPDRFADHARGLDAPADHAFAISPNDSTDLSETTRALYIGTGGDISLVTASGATVSFTTVLSGSILPVRCRRVRATGTTATGIVGLV